MPSGPTVRYSDTTPSSPLRYANKDGSKYITVNRKSPNPESKVAQVEDQQSVSQLNSNELASAMDYSKTTNDIPAGLGGQGASGASKKKKKKKSKGQPQHQPAAAIQGHLDSQSSFGQPVQNNHATNGPSTRGTVTGSPVEYQQHIKASLAEFEASELADQDHEDMYYSDEEAPYDPQYAKSNSHPQQPEGPPSTGKKKKNKKKKKSPNNPDLYQSGGVNTSTSGGGEKGDSGNQGSSKKAKDRIWNTSTVEERERIKEFWLSLGEEDRRSLVKVEKEAVLKKMKEQQKHSCSCSVCGRKRTAIEEELEVLYDAYYEELEQYANQQQSKFVGSVSPLPPHFSTRGPPPPPLGPPQNRIEELEDDEDDYEDDYEDDEGDDEDAEDEPLPENDPRHDFFTFGNSLTVQGWLYLFHYAIEGGILTVADDLLKNDGKKFIEMMEQLAERRMQREEEASAAASGHLNMTMSMSAHGQHPNNHPPQPEFEDEEEEEEDEEDYENYDDEEEEDEADPMTEEQRMEEGRRMFQIFAARMFEQRVLQAYREKVAQERQRRLLEELEEENRLKEEREQRRVKEKERKRDRKRQQKQAKEEERLRREAEKAAEEAALKAIEEKKQEELRKRREEQRLKKEAERRAMEEERQRKEEEKRKRLQEEREREAERERKRKEHQERERKKKEEAAKKAKEEKEAREKEAREKREKEERERRAREAKAKKQAEEEKLRREEEERRAAAAATNAAALAAARAQEKLAAVQSAQAPHQYNSPHLSVAAPAVPKQPISVLPSPRPRQASQQGSVGSSPQTPQVLPRINSSASPSTPILQQSATGPAGPAKSIFTHNQFTTPQPSSPLIQTPHTMGPPPGVPSPFAESSFPGLSPMGMNGLTPFIGGMPQRQGMGNGMPMYMQGPLPSGNPQYRGFTNTNGLPMPIPSAPGLRPVAQAGRGVFMSDLGGFPQPIGSPIPPASLPMFTPSSPFPMARPDTIPPAMHTHTRQHSGSFDDRPIHRHIQPTPIQRPQSTAPKPDDQSSSKLTVGELSNVLGSRALIDDDGLDMPFAENLPPTRRGSSIFSSRPSMGFGNIFGPIGTPSKEVFGTSPIVDWGTMPTHHSVGGWTNGAGWSDKDTPRRRRGETRLDQIRLLACKVCQEHSGPNNSFLEQGMVLKAMTAAAPPELQLPILQREIDDLVEVEGDAQNGGGSFIIDRDQHGNTLIKFEPSDLDADRDKVAMIPGEIGSPSTIGSFPSGGGFSGPVPPEAPLVQGGVSSLEALVAELVAVVVE
ncbi:salt tolerance down-regulator-domain-containing protein [Kalaharituber pfeilii]|nr:salt tolerance down-regulator-domain-containing protein [Kalaharituber pfeilii]